MDSIRRNAPCDCGSGKRRKHCHAAPPEVQVLPSGPEFERARRLAEAEIFQRVRQQGRGRPIQSSHHQGKRLVVVGKHQYLGGWKTFEDFLLPYLETMFGKAWGDRQLVLPEAEQHPFMQWRRVLSDLHSRHSAGKGEVFSTPSYGAATALTTLAYDVYTVQHNCEGRQAERSLELLLARLRDANLFFGARHELRAAGLLLRAGFHLEWEDEEDRSGRHCEFHAVWPASGRRFWVECRMRQPERQGGRVSFTHLVSDALQKPADAERLVFVELNDTAAVLDPLTGGWAPAAVKHLRMLEQQPSAVNLPQAEIILTNFPGHAKLEEVVPTAEVAMESFKSNRFRLGREEDLWHAIRTRDADPELMAIWKATHHLFAVPSTFDGSLPGIDESTRLLIGQTYDMGDGRVGHLEDAAVDAGGRKVFGILRSEDARHVVEFDLTDDEARAWRHHPETFFGEIRPRPGPIKDSLELFEFFESTLSTVTREDLLSQMKGWPNQSEILAMPREELVRQRAYAMTARAVQMAPLAEPPQWMRRMKGLQCSTPPGKSPEGS